MQLMVHLTVQSRVHHWTSNSTLYASFICYIAENIDVQLRRTNNFALNISYLNISIYSPKFICLYVNDLI